MDGLDALLADLQTTTSKIATQQQQQRQQQPANGHQLSWDFQVEQPYPSGFHVVTNDHDAVTLDGRLSGSSTEHGKSDSPDDRAADNLQPPPVSQLSVNAYAYGEDVSESESMYEPQNIRSNVSAPSVPVSIAAGSRQPAPSKATMTSLANNLSELDMLLNDLNSSTFMTDIDGQNGADAQQRPAPAPSRQPPPPVLPKPKAPASQPLNAPIYSQVQRRVVETDGSSDIGVRGLPSVSTSSATRELDELMNSLSQFKINATTGDTHPRQQPGTNAASHELPLSAVVAAGDGPHASSIVKVTPTQTVLALAKDGGSIPSEISRVAGSGGAGDLESLLGHLETDMTRQGVSVAARGRCAACSKPIAGQVITALGQVWHPEHFCCQDCGCELGAVSFFERDGLPYCERDYHELFAPKCAACNGPILDKCVTAMNTTWHPECFICSTCSRELNNEGFHEKDGQAYCRDDYFALFAPKCGGCGTPIVENYISALSRHWHPECFVCMDCNGGFAGGSFFEHEGLPYCETHYHAKKGSLCAGCQKPVTGRCITAMQRKFHPEHFVCAFCLKQLNKGTFKEQNDKPYCHACYVKLFG